MSDLITDLAARGWIAAEDGPIDVGLADWARVFKLLDGAQAANGPWHKGVRKAQWPALTAAQKVAVDVLTAWGHSAEEIADRLACTDRTVQRLRGRVVVGRPDPTLVLLFGWRNPHRARVEVQAGDLRAAPHRDRMESRP